MMKDSFVPEVQHSKLSIILPSIFPNLLERSIRNIYLTTFGCEYEIVVVSPFEVSGKHIVWVPEACQRGNVAAHSIGFNAASGDYIISISDDILTPPYWAVNLIDFIKKRESVLGNIPLVCGPRNSECKFGTVFGIFYPYFPCASRKTIEKIGGWFSTNYISHFGDPDIALRTWTVGGRCEICTTVRFDLVDRGDTAESSHKGVSLIRDMDSFCKTWAPKYGQGWDSSHLRGFNLDIPEHAINMLPQHSVAQLNIENTFYVNDPEIRNVIIGIHQHIFGI